MNNFFKSINSEHSFDENFDFLMKGIDKSKNHLKTITDKSGHTKKVWVANEGTETTDAGRNAGKQYEKTGKRHTSHSGFDSGDEVSFSAGGKTVTGTFRHVNENKHGAMAVIRGADGKLYERAVGKITKAKGGDAETRNKIRDMVKKESTGAKIRELPTNTQRDVNTVAKQAVDDKKADAGVGKHGFVGDGISKKTKWDDKPSKSTPKKLADGSTVSKEQQESHKRMLETPTMKKLAADLAGSKKAPVDDEIEELQTDINYYAQKGKKGTLSKEDEKHWQKLEDRLADLTDTGDSKPKKVAGNDTAEAKMKRVEAIKTKNLLDADLTKIKQAFKKVASKDEYNPVLDDANHGDASALKVLLKQWKHKAAQKGVDIASLGLKYKESETTSGKNTSEMPEA